MKINIIKDLPGRLRLRYGVYAFDEEIGYRLCEKIIENKDVKSVKTNHLNGSILIRYNSDKREELISYLKEIKMSQLPEITDADELNKIAIGRKFENNITKLIIRKFVVRYIVPSPIGKIYTLVRAAKRIWEALKYLIKGQIKVELLDATAISAALYQGDYGTANNIMFFLQFSDYLEEYVSSRAKVSLAGSLSDNIDEVWQVQEDGTDVKIPLKNIAIGDKIRVQMGSMVPVDGKVIDGLAMVDESSMTGEMMPSKKINGKSIYAGSVISEGYVIVEVTSLPDDSRISKILDMISDSQELKANVQSRAEVFADKIVPYSFIGADIIYLITRSIRKTLSVLMVDFSCAIKIATPLSVITALKEAADMRTLIKGGVYLEKIKDIDTIIFDKTGTLTLATPKVHDVISLSDYSRDEVLKYAACIEEHFPHSLAKAIVKKAQEEGLTHEEEHTQVEYVVAHGIATTLRGKRAIIGSKHFVFEDEKIPVTSEQMKIIDDYKDDYSLIYLSIGGKLTGFVAVYDPPRPETKSVIARLKDKGIKNIWMATGDGEKMAKSIAGMIGIDSDKIRYEVLPEDKINLVNKLKSEGHKVMMIGDGINDSPALAAADVSVSFKDSSDIARQVADVVISSGDLETLITLYDLSHMMSDRIENNFKFIISSNTLFMSLGILGLAGPGICALLHNSSTMYIALSSLRKYLG